MINESAKRLGRNIRWAREIRGYTLSQLADLVGDPTITQKMIGSWQRGQTRIYADQLVTISLALGVSMTTICRHPAQDIMTDDMRQLQWQSIPERDKHTIDYARRQWLGNARALGEYLRMYIAFETREQRYHVARYTLKYFLHCLKQGMKPRLDIDLDYLHHSVSMLKKGEDRDGEKVEGSTQSESDR